MTYVCFTQEFQLVGSDQQLLAKVRDYFGVEGGGLALNGTGPVVNEYHDGCAYELVGGMLPCPPSSVHTDQMLPLRACAVCVRVLCVYCALHACFTILSLVRLTPLFLRSSG